jgi:hypothetical protein
MISPFFQKSFWGGIGKGEFTFWDGNYFKELFFWVAWEGEVWLSFKEGKLGSFSFSKKIFLWWCRMGLIYSFFFFFFFNNMMT